MNERDLEVGDWVRHPEFGDGLILEAKGGGESASVLVSFPDKSQRRLMVKFARLSRLEPPPGPPSRSKEGKTARAKPGRKRAGGK
jgi:hypothetical protein